MRGDDRGGGGPGRIGGGEESRAEKDKEVPLSGGKLQEDSGKDGCH